MKRFRIRMISRYGVREVPFEYVDRKDAHRDLEASGFKEEFSPAGYMFKRDSIWASVYEVEHRPLVEIEDAFRSALANALDLY